MAAGTGNLILKRGLVIPNWNPVTLLEGMPAMQSVGVSQQTVDGTTAGVAYDNYPNRFWVGMDTYGANTGTGGGGSGQSETLPSPLPLPPTPSDYSTGPKRPLWVGAEIRAYEPVKRNPSDTFYTILKADWKNPSDLILTTQKSIFYYIRGISIGLESGGGLDGGLGQGSLAVLGSDGAAKGKQSFGSPIGIENYLELTGYSQNGINKPATITTAATTAASIFDTEITDLSMGGAAELIEIGDSSTDGNTATTIYGQLTVTGPTVLSTDTVIDGGTF